MAKMSKMTDKKDYSKRLYSSHTGEYKGSSMTDTSKYLTIKWDKDHGIKLTEDKIKFMKEYEAKNEKV